MAVPNSSTAVPCLTNGTSNVPAVTLLDINAIVHNVTVGPFNTLNIPGQSLTLDLNGASESLLNQGTIDVQFANTGNLTGSIVVNDANQGLVLSLNGSGALGLSGGSIAGLFGDGTLDNVQNTITGYGLISNLTVVNEASMTASGDDLEIKATPNASPEFGYPAGQFGFYNSGHVLVDAGRTLDINATTSQSALFAVVNRGVMTSDAGTINFTGASNQVVRIANTGVIALGSGTSPFGAITLNGQNAIFDFGGFGRGLGSLTLTGFPNNTIAGLTGTETFQNGLGSTLSGSGTVSNVTILNQGSIIANGANTLVLRSNSGGFVNDGPVEVKTGSTLNIDMTAASGAAFPVMNNGTMMVDGGAGLQFTAAAGQTAKIWNTGTIIAGGTTQGQLTTIDLDGNFATFDFVAVGAPGNLMLSDNASNTIVGGSGTETFINDAGETLSGAGTITNLMVVNKGTIVANGKNALTINPVTSYFDNRGGAVLVDSGSTLDLQQGAPYGFKNSGVITVNDGGKLLLSAPMLTTYTVPNTGSINIGSGGSGASMELSGGSSIFDFTANGGSGSITLSQLPISGGITGETGTEILMNDAGETLSGGGTVSNLTVVNNGSIVANSANPLIIQANPNPDLGPFAKSPFNVPDEYGFLNSSAGTVQVDSGSALELDMSASEIAQFPVINEGAINVDDGGALQLVEGAEWAAQIKNNWTITVGGAGSGGSIQLNGTDAAFDIGSFGGNTGTITLSDNAGNTITGNTGTETLINDTDSVLTGAGTISNVTLVNKGVIIASGANRLTIKANPNPIFEEGQPTDEFAFRNNGTVQVDPGSTLNLDMSASPRVAFNVLNGGTMTVFGGGALQFVAASNQITDIGNFGTITVGGPAPGGSVLLNGADATFDLIGPGNLTLSDNAANEITGVTGSELFINDAGSTLSGAGTISNLSLENSGTIIANGTNPLTIRTNANAVAQSGLPANSIGFLNNARGVVQVNSGSTLDLDMTASQNAEFPVFNQGAVTVNAGGALEFTANAGQTAPIGNTGTISVGGIGPGAAIKLNGRNATFDFGGFGGFGGIAFSKNPANAIYGVTSMETLINDAGSTLSGAGKISHLAFINYGTVDSDGFTVEPNSSSITNDGMINVDAGGSFTVNSDVNNDGAIDVLGGGSQAGAGGVLSIAGSLNNGGTLEIARSGLGGSFAGSATVEQSMSNSGTVRIDPGAELTIIRGAYTQSAGSTDVDGSLITPAMNVTGGALTSGGGFIETQTLHNGALLTADSTGFIGVGPGPFTATSGFQQQAGGTLDELITSPSSFGVISVTGAASLNGTLDVTLGNGFIPGAGDQFAFLEFTPGDLSGAFSTFLDQTFDNGLEKWTLTYDNAGGRVYLTAETNAQSPTPEPATLLLFGTGLLAAAWAFRKKPYLK